MNYYLIFGVVLFIFYNLHFYFLHKRTDRIKSYVIDIYDDVADLKEYTCDFVADVKEGNLKCYSSKPSLERENVRSETLSYSFGDFQVAYNVSSVRLNEDLYYPVGDKVYNFAGRYYFLVVIDNSRAALSVSDSYSELVYKKPIKRS